MDSFSVTCFAAKSLPQKQSTTKLPFTLALAVKNWTMEKLIQRIKEAPINEPNSPWVKVGAWSVNGLRALGYSGCSRYILTETTDGRGLFDCATGEKIFRDRSEYLDQERLLVCPGIGPVEGEIVRMSGLEGGGMPKSSSNGWRIETISYWPKTEILLFSPDNWLYGRKYGKPDNFLKIWSGYELRACGFSYSGDTLFIGESSGLVIYSRVGC